MIRIIVADDHAMFRQGLVTLMSGADDISIVAECASGLEAIDAVKKYLPDVAVMDISMPGLDGISATRQIIEEGGATRVVILTMHDTPKVRKQAESAGADAFVLKDNAFEQLLATIRSVASSSVLSTSRSLSRKHQMSDLTERETEILRLVAEGHSNRSISLQLDISIKTVDTHRTNLMRKLDIHSTVELVRHAIAAGII